MHGAVRNGGETNVGWKIMVIFLDVLHIFMGFFFVMSPGPAIVTGVDCVSCDIGGWAAFGREIGPLQGLIIRLSYFLA